MSLKKLAQGMEIRIWDKLIEIMNQSKLVQGLIHHFYSITHSKPGFIAIIFIIWSTIGFLTGLIVARLLLLLQFQ